MDLIRRALILLLIFIVGVIHPFNLVVQAQSGQSLEVVSVNTEGFPVVRVQFEAYNTDGNFVTDLRAGDVLIREDDRNITVSDLELLRPGVQFIVALNQGPDLSNRYAGVSRYEAIRQTLETWIETQGDDSSDQFSLATNTGLQLIHSRDAGEWMQAVQGLESVDLLQERPSMVALSRAVDLATDPNPDNVMKRAILFITPMIPAADLEALPNLADRAAEQGVPVHVWLVASPAARTNNPQFFDLIEQMTVSTGGELFIFSGPEDLPDPDNVLNPSRFVYRAQYLSQINNSATHVIGIEVRRGNFQQRSADKPVYLDVLPPIPIFLSPQSAVERKWVSSENPRTAVLEPESLEMRIVVEYPDGKPREIKASRLYVNDVLVDQNLVEPFDILEWPLDTLQEGRFILRAEVEDSLGLRQSSIDFPVSLSVEVIEMGWWQSVMAGDRPRVIGAIAAAGLLLLFSLTLAGRGVVQAVILRRKRALDPLTQPLPAPKERPSKVRPKFHVERSTWPRQAMAGLSAAPAWLVRLPDNGDNPMNKGVEGERPVNPTNAIPLTRREISLGSDVLRAQYCVDSLSVSGLHARILQTPEGGCQIFDADSVAGTWVNFVQVPEDGVLLQHGDLIHLGRVAFRFELANPPEQSQPRVRSFQDIV